MAKRKANSNPASSNCSPVHQMMSSSTNLLQRVIQLGRKQSVSVDDLQVLNSVPPSDYKPSLTHEGHRYLQSIVDQARSQTQMDTLKSPNTLMPPDPFFRYGHPSLSCNDLPTSDDDSDNDSTPGGNQLDKDNDETFDTSSTRVSIRDSSGPKVISHNGRRYEAIKTEDQELEPIETQGLDRQGNNMESMTPVSCDHVTVVVDTEESDLEMTPGGLDHVTSPLLAKCPPDDIESQVKSRKSSVKKLGSTNLAMEDAQQSSVMYDESDRVCGAVANSRPSWKTKTVAGKLNLSDKSVSFENPSYADIELTEDGAVGVSDAAALGALRKVQSDHILQQRPSTLPLSPNTLTTKVATEHAQPLSESFKPLSDSTAAAGSEPDLSSSLLPADCGPDLQPDPHSYNATVAHIRLFLFSSSFSLSKCLSLIQAWFLLSIWD